jgi:glycosyltransferase 2 family protein
LRAPPRKVLIAAQLAAAAILLYFIGRELGRRWADFRSTPLETDIAPTTILVSGAIVLGAYALLVQTWRILLAGAGASLRFWTAARIWSVSNLWRYVPGKVWQIGAMGAMAQRAQISPVAAAGTAIVSTILNIATGIAIVLLLGWRSLAEWNAGAHPVAIGLLVAAVVGLAAMPYALPRLSAMAARMMKREVRITPPPRWAIVIATVGNLLSWILYGVAFQWLARGLLGQAAAPAWQYIAVFAASYVVGYLFLFIPGGIGPREAVMMYMLTSLSMANPKEAALLTAGSRIWLTFLELVPGFVFLAYGRIRRPPQLTPRTDVSSGPPTAAS